MSDPIKAALDAAVKAEDQAAATMFYQHEVTAAAIAAFLRALPSHITLPTGNGGLIAGMSGFAMLAAAVEKAARDG